MNIWISAFRRSLSSRLLVFLFVVTFVYAVSAFALSRLYDGPLFLDTMLYSNVFHTAGWIFLLGFVCFRALYVMIVDRPQRLTRAILADLRGYFSAERLCGGIPVLFVFLIFLSVFTSFKSMIPVIQPFAYDAAFARADEFLHFGMQPWEIFFPLFGNPWMTSFISLIYKTWFIAKFSMLLYFAFSLKRPALRDQFLTAFMLCWIVNGTVLAILLSSAGPCYYGLVTDGINPYAPLMEFLRESHGVLPVWDLYAQDYLWKAYETMSVHLFSGISAMPSMHISLCVLFALAGWRIGRKTGLLFTAYLVLMFIGSVHLGWHYAIDGYVAGIVTVILWAVCGALIKSRMWCGQPESNRHGIAPSGF